MESENMKEEKEIQKEKDCLIEYKSIYTKYL